MELVDLLSHSIKFILYHGITWYHHLKCLSPPLESMVMEKWNSSSSMCNFAKVRRDGMGYSRVCGWSVAAVKTLSSLVSAAAATTTAVSSYVYEQV